jgi:hypothetical protein
LKHSEFLTRRKRAVKEISERDEKEDDVCISGYLSKINCGELRISAIQTTGHIFSEENKALY